MSGGGGETRGILPFYIYSSTAKRTLVKYQAVCPRVGAGVRGCEGPIN